MVSGQDARRVTATLGTDHHRFDRLVRWLDDWVAERGDVSALVQHGHSMPPRVAEGVSMLCRDMLLAELQRARVVVTHGGTGAVMDARSRGHIPVVVPRTAARREHVDDHQVGFARRMAERGWIHLAESEEDLRAHLERALADPAAYRLPDGGPSVVAAVPEVREILADVLRRPPGTISPRRLAQVLRYLVRR